LGQEYYIRVGAVDDFGNVSELSAAVTGTPKETYDGWEQYLSAGGSEDGGCFIATAAFGSYVEPHVIVLRQFRDDILLTSTLGREFVSWYYRTGPSWATWLNDNAWAKTWVQAALMPLVWTATLALSLNLSLMGLLISMGTLFAGVLLISRRRQVATVAVGGQNENA